MIGEVLIHHLDVLRWLLGPLSVVAARTLRLSPSVMGEDMALVVLEGNRFWITLEGNLRVPGAPANSVDRLQLTGTDGVLSLENNLAQITGPSSRSATFDLVTGYGDSYAAAIAHFADSLRAGTPFETDVRDNLHTLALVEQSYAKAGEPG
jgi:predicted dehydrogenase